MACQYREHLSAREDDAQLHAAAARARAGRSRARTTTRTDPRAVATSCRTLIAWPVNCTSTGSSPTSPRGLDEALRLVAAQVAELPVVASVRASEDKRNVPQGVRHGHPCTAAGPQHPRELAERGAVVRNVLEHGDRERGAERARCQRQLLGRAADPQRALADALRLRELPRSEQALERQIAADRRPAGPRRFDHGVAGSADADVDERRRPSSTPAARRRSRYATRQFSSA